jgi:hypothetical protein
VSLRINSARAGDAESNATVASAAVSAIFRIIVSPWRSGEGRLFVWMHKLAIGLPAYPTKVLYRAKAGKLIFVRELAYRERACSGALVANEAPKGAGLETFSLPPDVKGSLLDLKC